MMKQRMNVLHVISALPVGGVENQLCLVLKRYDRARVFPCVCSLSDKGEVGREIEAAGIEVVSLNKLRHGFDWGIVKDLMRVIRQRDIQVVRTHQYHANLYGRLAAWLCRVPCIVPSIHNVYTRDRKVHRRVLNNLLGRISDRVIAVSAAVKDDIMAYDGLSADKITVLYNGVEEDRFAGVDGAGARAVFRIPADAIVVGTVGRLKHQKGQKYLVEAMSDGPEKISPYSPSDCWRWTRRERTQRTRETEGDRRQCHFYGLTQGCACHACGNGYFCLPVFVGRFAECPCRGHGSWKADHCY